MSLELKHITPELVKKAKLRLAERVAEKQAELRKVAFTPMDAQGPMPPPGGPPPGAGGPPPGGDPSQGGPPPGGDPSQGGPPPGGDPSQGGGGPPQAVTVSMQDLMQLFQQVAGGAGGGGAPNEPGKAKGAGKDQILTEIKDKITNLENQYHQLFAFLTGAQMQQGGQPPDGAGNAPPGMGGGMDPSQMGAAMQPGDPSQGGGAPPPDAGGPPPGAGGPPPGMQQQASLRPLAKIPPFSKEAELRKQGKAMSSVLARLSSK
jgi:hypothetical protein